MNVDSKVTGFAELQATLARLSSEAETTAALRPAMNKVGTKILKRSVDLTPRDRGGLVNSAGIRTDDTGRAITVTIGYGAIYARRVHDNPRAGHTGGVGPNGQRYRHWAKTGQHQYLQTAMTEARATAWPDVAREVEAWLRQHAR